MKYKKSNTYVRDRTSMVISRLKNLSARDRAVFDVLRCLPGIDRNGWKGSIRKIVQAYMDITGSKISNKDVTESLNNLTTIGQLEPNRTSYHETIFRIIDSARSEAHSSQPIGSSQLSIDRELSPSDQPLIGRELSATDIGSSQLSIKWTMIQQSQKNTNIQTCH